MFEIALTFSQNQASPFDLGNHRTQIKGAFYTLLLSKFEVEVEQLKYFTIYSLISNKG